MVVVPELRMGWANTLLKYHCAEQVVQRKRKALRFVAHDRHRDTRRMAEMCKARLVRTMWIPYRTI